MSGPQRLTTQVTIKRLVSRLVQLPAQDTTMFGVQPADVRESLARSLERYAVSDEHAGRMVEWLLFERQGDSARFRPEPVEFRQAAEAAGVTAKAEVEDQKKKIANCTFCGGTGFTTPYRLVTYAGGYQIKKCEKVEGDQEWLLDFRAKLGANQDILSAAVPCVCLPANHVDRAPGSSRANGQSCD